jgi:hypothetical protein
MLVGCRTRDGKKEKTEEYMKAALVQAWTARASIAGGADVTAGERILGQLAETSERKCSL